MLPLTLRDIFAMHKIVGCYILVSFFQFRAVRISIISFEGKLYFGNFE